MHSVRNIRGCWNCFHAISAIAYQSMGTSHVDKAMSGERPELLAACEKEAAKIIQWAQSTPYDETSIKHLGGVLADFIASREHKMVTEINKLLGLAADAELERHEKLWEKVELSIKAREQAARLEEAKWWAVCVDPSSQFAQAGHERIRALSQPVAETPHETHAHVHTPYNTGMLTCCTCGWKCRDVTSIWHTADECERQWREHVAASSPTPARTTPAAGSQSG